MFATLLIWNVLLAALLALLVTLAGQTRYLREYPALRHSLWLLVLCKFVTPPLVPLPVVAPNLESTVADLVETNAAPNTALFGSVSRTNDFGSDLSDDVADKGMQDVPTPFDGRHATTESDVQDAVSIHWIVVLVSISLVVTVVLVVRMFMQLRRLSHLLRRGDCGSSRINAIAQREARRMGIRQVPHVRVVNSVISPLLWVKRARPVVVLPESLLLRFDDEQIAYVVKHELAHFARRDHWSNALACLVGCLFWWNPVVWWARRELRVAQEACCDAEVIAGTSTIRRTYAETLLQVIDFVGGERSAPQLVPGFGEASSITRRFEMIANDRVTHRLSRVTGLFVTILFGMACSYPVLAQPANNTESRLPDASNTMNGEDDDKATQDSSVVVPGHASAQSGSSGDKPDGAIEFDIEFRWIPKHVATATFRYLDGAQGQGVLTLRAERYPESSLIKLLRAMHGVTSVSIVEVTTEIHDLDSGFVTVILKSEPFDSRTLPRVITDLSVHFRIKRLRLFPPSIEIDPTEQGRQGGFRPGKSRFAAELRVFRDELLDAIRSALPRDVDDAHWQIELQYFEY